MPKKIAVQTLGCRLNSHETDALTEKFLAAGFELVTFNDYADVYIINTCTVTAKSDRKSRNFIRKAQRNEDALVIVTGCFADNPRGYIDESPLTFMVKNDQKSQIYAIVDSFFQGELLKISDLESDRFSFQSDTKNMKTRATIKIQDGCENFCTYCIIPYVRGKAVSREFNEIIDEAKKIIEQGYKEIVLTGINISRYDFEDKTLFDVIGEIIAIPGEFRVHIPSIEPENFSDDFIKLLSNPKLCPHIHLCLQSGNDTILKAMNRKYSIDHYRNIVSKIRKFDPKFNITTDIIVGFPGETADDFQATLDLVKEFNFGHVHTFKYSQREGTPAAKLKNQVPEKVKSERSERLRLLSKDVKSAYRHQFIGENLTMLVEKVDEESASGFSQNYLPMKVLNPQKISKNSLVNVTVVDCQEIGDDFILIAEEI